MQITYQKKDGCIIQRLRNTMLPYKVGETTSMGWKVLSIEYEYKNKYYSAYNYNKIINKEKQVFLKRKHIAELIVRKLGALLYYLFILILLKFILGI